MDFRIRVTDTLTSQKTKKKQNRHNTGNNSTGIDFELTDNEAELLLNIKQKYKASKRRRKMPSDASCPHCGD